MLQNFMDESILKGQQKHVTAEAVEATLLGTSKEEKRQSHVHKIRSKLKLKYRVNQVTKNSKQLHLSH